MISIATLTPADFSLQTPGSDKLHHVIGFGGMGSYGVFWPDENGFCLHGFIHPSFGWHDCKLIQPSVIAMANGSISMRTPSARYISLLARVTNDYFFQVKKNKGLMKARKRPD